MNILLISAGIFTLFTMIGHLAVGQKLFLYPMLQADFSLSAKKVMHSAFNYLSVFLILSSIGLFASGFGLLSAEGAKPISLFIAFNYLFFAIWQIIIALKSGLKKPLLKLFQWMLFFIISAFTIGGVLTI